MLHRPHPPTSNSSVQIQMTPKPQFESVPRDTEGSEFLRDISCHELNELHSCADRHLLSRTQWVVSVPRDTEGSEFLRDINCHELNELHSCADRHLLSRTQWVVSVPRDTEGSEFLDWVDFGDVVFSGQTLLVNRPYLWRSQCVWCHELNELLVTNWARYSWH